ncbi:capsular polysaccharide export protein, LipB/KpsS family, partial [Neisseria weixii]|uniref:capsular polysaccharide export protein, LipB/KpsS family n=1 Tax=Neisseria weixii TaxID=1853276 RepID=UPI0040396A40
FAKQIEAGKFGKFFVVPLQVFNDSQVRIHCDFSTVRSFLLHVLTSFANHAPDDVNLIIKHHPMDRGFIDYARDIKHFVKKHPKLKGRITYVHDVPLPVFLRHGIGMVTINSTSGLSALIHNMPVKVLGRAHYDIPGMTCQGKLADFWNNPTPPDSRLFHAYRMYHINVTQINGSFYSQVNFPDIQSED